MSYHRLVLYHHVPLLGSTVRGNHDYAYHTHKANDDFRLVQASRESFCTHVGFSHLITLHQTHSSVVHRITEENLRDFLVNPLVEGDGLWTTLSDILLGIFTADCLPIFFWAEDVIGIVHAGRRGVYSEIHLRLAEELLSAGYVPQQIRVLIGPHIRECCYEVGEDVIQETSTRYASKRFSSWYLNLEKKVVNDLCSLGMTNIEQIPLCAKCSDESLWYSYRRGEKYARHLHFIGKRKK